MIDYDSFSVLILALVSIAFFSGIEFAFNQADKSLIELRNKQGLMGSKVWHKFAHNPSEMLATTTIGNIISLVVYSVFIGKALEAFITSSLDQGFMYFLSISALIVGLAIVLLLLMIKLATKSVYWVNPNHFLTFLTPLFVIVHYGMYPLVKWYWSLSKFLNSKILKKTDNENQHEFSFADFKGFSTHISQETRIAKSEVNNKIITNALEFETVRLRDCMIPRTEIVAIDIEDGMEELKKKFIESGHSKIIIYKESIDEVIGYCNSLALFKKPSDINKILLPIIIVPETMMAKDLMVDFIRERKSLALVIDEFGGTAGLVSIEDIIEEILGDIQDEHDDDELIEYQIDSNNFLLSARQEIDYLNEKYNWNLPEGDYDTLGGYILSITEDIPSKNEIIESPGFIFTIEAMLGTRIDTVRVSLIGKDRSDN